MFFQVSDTRTPLKPGDVIESAAGKRIIIDRHVGSGGFALMYIAHHEGSSRYVALKELFPRQLDNLIVQRREDGRIVICDPASGDAIENNTAIWKEIRQYFDREAALTRKAGAVYDRSGHQAAQNNPDVLHAEGPFRDNQGNIYLSIDTYQGEPLRDLIERGFLRDEDGTVMSNHLLDEILDVLSETAVRLAALHGAGIWHLDLSPDNIYVVPSAGHTRLTPYIIDYGSSYDCTDPAHAADHRYTCNPFSAPEILALAQLNDSNCGYETDPSSDTYALASILFYAVTGQVFTAEHRMNCSGWQEQIRREYAAGLPSHHGADSFAGSLIDFFNQGLAAAQRDRHRSPKALLNAIQTLRDQYRQYGNLLPLVPQDELMSYMVLEKYPLYRYRGSDGNIHVLCLGSGVFVRRMILSLISCGQMIGSRLYIHVVSNEPEEMLRSHLCTVAPMLKSYSNPNAPADQEYVTFSYHQVSDILDEAVCAEVLAGHANCRYILVSLGSNRSNVDAARMYALHLAQMPNQSEQQTVINYYCSEDAANNIYALLDGQTLPKWLEVDAFGKNISTYSKVIRSLGLRTLKLSHLYNKLGNPRISLAESVRKLSGDEYAQRSSCAAALHLKYKLASSGINLSPKTTKRAIITAYQKVLADHRFGEQMELEHRRWMMYMIADGYQIPTPAQLNRFGFEMVDGTFNPFWRCRQKLLHPCLVPCSTAGVILKNEDWKRYSTAKEIEESSFDQLDKVSLQLHLRSGKKCSRILEDGIITDCFRKIEKKLSYAQDDSKEDQTSGANAIPFKAMSDALTKVRNNICLEAERLNYAGDQGQLAKLLSLFSQWDINISGEIDALRQALSVFVEYKARRDYKKPDETIIRHLLWLLYADNDITCIKLRGRTITDNITGPLILEPHRLVFFGQEHRPEWDEFLKSHGNRGEIVYLPHCGNTVDQITTCLKRVAAQQRDGCIIDITGAEELMAIAAQRVADANSKVSLIRCTPDGHVENIQRFPNAPAYTLNTTISADEIFSLHGARKHPNSNRYMEQLEKQIPQLWSFFQEFRNDWNEITAFFANRGGVSSELFLRNVRVNDTTVFKPYSRKIDKAKWDALDLGTVFGKLQDAGIIRQLQTDEYLPGRLILSFLYPSTDEKSGNDSFHKSLDQFFIHKIQPIFVPLQCKIKDKSGKFTVEISSGCRVDIYDKQSIDFVDHRYQYHTEPIPYSRVIPALKRLEEMRMIAELEVSEQPDVTPVSIRFIYPNPALRTCFATAGNILELYIWMEAKNTHAFDNIQPNLSFTWREGVDNELDVIMTKELTSLIVSAKTARFNREHLYEIKYLTEHFSLNSKPVIVYSSDHTRMNKSMVDDMLAVKQRAKAMGVYLIDLNDLQQGQTLGSILAAIADGTAPL